MNLAAVLDAAQPTATGFTTTVPASWHQGRTAYGGFSAALASTAARRIGAESLRDAALPPLRSALVSFIAPLAGEIAVTARPLRSGRNAHWLAAEIAGEAGIGLTASFVFMQPGPGGLALDRCPAPTGRIAAEHAVPIPVSKSSPQFLRNHFDLRFALPRCTEKQPDICWWVRPRGYDTLDPMSALLVSADALPPGVLPLLGPGARVSSMTWQLNLLSPAPATREGWWLLRSTGDHAEHGCSSQRMSIWNADGEAIATGMQSIAYFTYTNGLML